MFSVACQSVHRSKESLSHDVLHHGIGSQSPCSIASWVLFAGHVFGENGAGDLSFD